MNNKNNRFTQYVRIKSSTFVGMFKTIFTKFILFFILLSTLASKAQENILPHITYVKPDSIINKKYLIGDFDPEYDQAFILIDSIYANKSSFFIQKDVYKAFLAMYNNALKDSINLQIISATRNCNYQKTIWDEKWYGVSWLNNKNISKIDNLLERTKTLIKYVAMPQTSRHHWGTDIDLNSADTSYYSTPDGIKLYTWLKNNAPTYGFCQPYTLSNEIIFEAYQEEKWHWSYVPLSYLFLKNYKKQISYKDLNGFMGANYAKSIKVIEKYATRVDPGCF